MIRRALLPTPSGESAPQRQKNWVNILFLSLTPVIGVLGTAAYALADGTRIRFFEHAFEWDQMQYVFYPYFWARPGGWADRFHARNMDPFLEEFLKAGYARVVVPVRPGFEAAG